MNKTILWSNFEMSPFIEREAKKAGIQLVDLTDEQLLMVIKKFDVENKGVLDNIIKPSYNKTYSRPLVTSAIVMDDKRQKIGQTAMLLGYHSNAIFELPYDFATWYYDRWNLNALIKYQGFWYEYTFREVRPDKNVDVYIDNISKSKKMLTPTYMGNYTQTLLINKRRNNMGGV